jgi:hypothetical protein
MTYFIHMIMSCKQSYFLIYMGVRFSHSNKVLSGTSASHARMFFLSFGSYVTSFCP